MLAKQLENNPFFRLEHKQTDFGRAKVVVPKLASIQELSERTWKEDWEASRRARAHFREGKRAAQLAHDREEGLRAKLAVPISLQKERPEDAIMARNVVVERKSQAKSESLAQAVRRIQRGSIFAKSAKKGGARLCTSATTGEDDKKTTGGSMREVLELRGKK